MNQFNADASPDEIKEPNDIPADQPTGPIDPPLEPGIKPPAPIEAENDTLDATTGEEEDEDDGRDIVSVPDKRKDSLTADSEEV